MPHRKVTAAALCPSECCVQVQCPTQGPCNATPNACILLCSIRGKEWIIRRTQKKRFQVGAMGKCEFLLVITKLKLMAVMSCC